ncbi:MAG: SDR family NAD(P)-dependent oxidoreductase [Hyphomicrobiales bacterium]
MPATDIARTHPAIVPGRTAVITGGASGIGLASARRLASEGAKVVIADLTPAVGKAAADEVGGAFIQTDVTDAEQVENLFHSTVATDVSSFEQVKALRDAAYETFGDVAVLMNNAGAGSNPGKPWEDLAGWRKLLDVNLWGVIHGVQAFVPAMLAHGKPGLVVNTGSKQGITLPPGNSAYNLSKAGVKAFTELLAHELRNQLGAAISAHLLIPGFTFTGMTGGNLAEKPEGAWTPEQVVEFMIASVGRGDFYILCPDNEVTRDIDEARMQWTAGDIIENRPALSRWHPDHREAFAQFMADRRSPR